MVIHTVHSLYEHNVHHHDCAQVSKDGFCTVLEHCDGGDLEQILKERKTLPEREARYPVPPSLPSSLSPSLPPSIYLTIPKP